VSDQTDDLRAKTDEYWREHLTEEQYRILRESGTEPPFTGALLHVKKDGSFRCAGCGAVLFASGTKFDSGSGWPSFYDVVDSGTVELIPDRSHGTTRTEVRCAACGGHLGHRFDDGPQPTGLRYCINSAALEFDSENSG